MMRRSLDLATVRAFVLIAEMRSFTRAAETLGVTQASVSLMLKRLEECLECRLVERSPRHVELSAKGALFLDHARKVLLAQDSAFTALGAAREKLTIGISDHVAGPDLAGLIARINAQDPGLLIEVRIGSSVDLLRAYDRRELDVALTRFTGDHETGEVITTEPFHWFASTHWQFRTGNPLPIATMPEPCGVRLLARQLLDEAGISWSEVFVGGGVLAVSAAVQAGIGVAALARRMVPLGVSDVGPRLGLPELPSLPIVLHARTTTDRRREAVAILRSSFKSAVAG